MHVCGLFMPHTASQTRPVGPICGLKAQGQESALGGPAGWPCGISLKKNNKKKLLSLKAHGQESALGCPAGRPCSITKKNKKKQNKKGLLDGESFDVEITKIKKHSKQIKTKL